MWQVKTFLLLFLAALSAASAQAAERAAVFEFEFIDTSLEGEMKGTSEAETARLAKLSIQARQLLAQYAGYDIVDLAPVADEARNANLQSCGSCDAAMAEKLGADIAVTGTVQKVSDLILNINLYLRDVKTKRIVKQGSVDIRGNTDESWMRGLKYLVKNRLFKG